MQRRTSTLLSDPPFARHVMPLALNSREPSLVPAPHRKMSGSRRLPAAMATRGELRIDAQDVCETQ